METNRKSGGVVWNGTVWSPPAAVDVGKVPLGDMPGDKVKIGDQHVFKANVVFPSLLDLLAPLLAKRSEAKAVVAVHGGSGVGKSEIGSLLAYHLTTIGIRTYVLSGDNYPHRIPRDNDHERLLVFREAGLKGLVAAGEYTAERNVVLHSLQALDEDASAGHLGRYPWLAAYQNAGRLGLEQYLGTPREIDFEEFSRIVERFKAGESPLMLKRMGQEPSELWYDPVDLSAVRVLLIEWTHGNSDHVRGVDIPILLNSTPQETLEHRRSRGRDGAVDSPFTTLVLEIEQEKLASQASKAKLIVSKSGEVLTFSQFQEQRKRSAAQP